jgi:CheY-like chemotaxis protein
LKNKQIGGEIIVQKGMPRHLFFDDTKLTQILYNLLSNSIKFTDDGNVRIIFSFRQCSNHKTFSSQESQSLTSQKPSSKSLNMVNHTHSIITENYGILRSTFRSVAKDDDIIRCCTDQQNNTIQLKI